MNIGQNIAKAREASGLTQLELAKRTGLSQAYIALIEKGHKKPTTDNIIAFSLELVVSADELLGLKTEVLR